MNNLTEAYVDSLALNGAAIKNGRDLVKKNSFPVLHQSEDLTLLFGECKGSGSQPYRCSVDFASEGIPVFRCTCPSRQFPCKHLLGLMYAYTTGVSFTQAPIPQDIVDKREKADKREEKKKEQDNTAEPVKRKVNKSALVKKLAVQLDGLDIAEKLLLQLVQSGIGSVDKRTLQTMEEQIKQVGSYYIPGIQYALRNILMKFYSKDHQESIYSHVLESSTILHSVLKKGRDYLQSRLDNPAASMDTASNLEEWLGHAWQLAELKEYGRARDHAELLQLAFYSYADQPRGEFVDEGFWINLQSGCIHTTRTYRPFKAAKYIREDDSFFQVVQAKELFEYPGERNTRVRWEESESREAVSADYAQVQAAAVAAYPDVIKQVKNQIKNPLSDKHPVFLLRFSEIQQAGDAYVILDEQGKQLLLKDIPALSQPSVYLLPLLNKAYLKQQALLVMFEHDVESNRLVAQPLSLITPTEVIRLLY